MSEAPWAPKNPHEAYIVAFFIEDGAGGSLAHWVAWTASSPDDAARQAADTLSFKDHKRIKWCRVIQVGDMELTSHLEPLFDILGDDDD